MHNLCAKVVGSQFSGISGYLDILKAVVCKSRAPRFTAAAFANVNVVLETVFGVPFYGIDFNGFQIDCAIWGNAFAATHFDARAGGSLDFQTWDTREILTKIEHIDSGFWIGHRGRYENIKI